MGEWGMFFKWLPLFLFCSSYLNINFIWIHMWKLCGLLLVYPGMGVMLEMRGTMMREQPCVDERHGQ